MANILAICTYTIVCSVFSYLGLKQDAIMIFSVLICIDFLTWVIKSFYIRKDITSARAGHGLVSKFLLLLIPIVVALAGKIVGMEMNWFVSSSLAMLSLAECYSIIWNIVATIERKEYKEFDAITMIIRWIMDLIRRYLEKVTRQQLDDHGLKRRDRRP